MKPLSESSIEAAINEMERGLGALYLECDASIVGHLQRLFGNVKEAVQGAKASSPQNTMRWIDVNDRLPGNTGWCNDEVLFVTSGVVRKGGYDYEDGFWYERDGGKYQDAAQIKNGAKQNGGIVTHWMPLPAPPSEENDESSSPKNTAIEEIECYVPVSVEKEFPEVKGFYYVMFADGNKGNDWYYPKEKRWASYSLSGGRDIVAIWFKKTTLKVLKETLPSSPQSQEKERNEPEGQSLD